MTRTLLALAVLAVSAWLMARAVSEIGWADLARRLGDLPPWAAAATGALLVARFVALHLRWSSLLERLGALPPPLYRFAMLMSAVLVNHITPTARVAGGLLRTRYVSRWSGLAFSTVYGAVLLDQAAHQVVIGGLTWLAFAAFAWLIGSRILAVTALAVLAVVLTVVAPRLLRRPAPATEPQETPEPITRLARLAAAGRRALGSFRRLVAEPRLRRRLIVWSLAFMAANVAAQWVVFSALGNPMPLVAVTVGVLLGAAAGTLSGTPGGLGSTEAAMIATYRALDLPGEEALAGTLLVRGLHYSLVLALGIPAITLCELRQRRAAARAGQPRPASGP